MSKYLFINYPKCGTCVKAKKWLEENNIDYDARNIVQDKPTRKELELFYKKSGKELKKFFNTSGILYREKKLKDKLPNMTEKEMLEELSTDGMLVKRPLLIGEQGVLLGFKQEEWEQFFKIKGK